MSQAESPADDSTLSQSGVGTYLAVRDDDTVLTTSIQGSVSVTTDLWTILEWGTSP